MHSELAYLSAIGLSARYQNRELSPVDVTRAMLERIETLNPILNMIYHINADQALQQARESERRWLDGNSNGPLDGVPTTIKDGLATRGMPSFRGSAANLTAQQQWTTDAPCVARLKEQGVVILGKNTMPDFGILASGISSQHGVTRNPWNLRRNTGGSSSGAAASIAAGVSPVSIGTDIVGSIRLPASFCGLFGHKPSQGRVPYYPPTAPTLVAGPMARSVQDAALLLNVISQPDPRDFTALPYDGRDYLEALEQPPRGVRLGYLPRIGFGPQPDPEVLAAVEGAAAAFADCGYSVQALETPFTAGDDECAVRFYRTRCYTELSSFPEDIQRKSPILYPWTRAVEGWSAHDLYRAKNELLNLRERTLELFQQVDFLLLPAVAVPAFEAEAPAPDPKELFAPWSNNFLFNLTEQPACSINCGYTSDGLPVGLQIVGPRFEDLAVLQLARLYEKIRGPQRKWPNLGTDNTRTKGGTTR